MNRLVVLCLCVPLSAMNLNHDPRVFIDNAHRAGHPEFFTSFKNPVTRFVDILQLPDAVMHGGVVDAGALDLVPMVDVAPYIGHYQNPGTLAEGRTRGDQYNFRVRLALIQYRDGAFGVFLPAVIRGALARAGFVDLSRVEFSAQVLGTFVNPVQAPFTPATKDTCNIAYHSVVRRWRGTGMADFNEPVACGVFALNGAAAVPGGMAVDRLAELSVYYHDRVALSPDVGRVFLLPGRGIVTFWTVAVYQGRAQVTFNVIANNAQTEHLLLALTEQRNFDGVLAHMVRVIEQLENTADVEALIYAYEILRDAQTSMSEATAVRAPVVLPRPFVHAPAAAADALVQRISLYIESYGSVQAAISAAIDNHDIELVNALLEL